MPRAMPAADLSQGAVKCWPCGLMLVTGLVQVGGGAIGESWNRSSWIQLGGFVVLLLGTINYAQASRHSDSCFTTLYVHLHVLAAIAMCVGLPGEHPDVGSTLLMPCGKHAAPCQGCS
jgi:hypothetical protein